MREYKNKIFSMCEYVIRETKIKIKINAKKKEKNSEKNKISSTYNMLDNSLSKVGNVALFWCVAISI